MRFRALGPITVEVDGQEAKLGGLRQQIVLAVLLSRANQVVPQDGLIDSVWAGEAPEAARATLQSYIYNLRRSIGTDAILRRGDGYLIQADPTSFDVLDFAESVSEGHRMLATDPDAARTALLGGLALWFGSPYGGVDHPELFAEINRLTEMRINAIETRIKADLALGRDAELVGELETLAREYPFRERFWAQLMLALYRSGRQAEALRTYARARARLVDDLGIEPGTALQQLEERVLAQDPTLLVDRDSAKGRVADGEPHAVRGYELRGVIGSTPLGVAYRAYQPAIAREVVVKVIRPEFANDTEFVARFERDAQTVATLEHPHVLPLHDYWRDPTGAYLVVPFMTGGSLARALRAGAWNLGPAMRLLDQVGKALTYAHRRGVIHGYLTASSVVLDEEGNAYVGDFGIGRVPPDDHATVRSDVQELGALTLHLLTGTASPQVPIDTTVPAEMAAVIERATAADPEARYQRVSDYLRELRRAGGVDVSSGPGLAESTTEPIRNPYKGLRAFTEEDSADFHGRSDLVNELLERLADHRLVTLVGPSGSGKSSVVRAGVIPNLRAGGLPGSRSWLITDMFPGSYPFEELEAALTRVAVRGAAGMLSELTEPTGLLRVCKQILPDDDSTMLIVIDQFEELFSLVRSEEKRRLFLENLVAVADDERGRIRVMTTIRADFLDRPLSYGDFAAAMAPGLVTAGPPTRDGLAQAIAAPARAVGLELEPGLVARIVADVEGQPGALPLLQHALTETFAARDGPTLSIEAYESTGGVAGALGRRAEELYDNLSPGAKYVAREVFLRLVSVNEVGVVTRRRARRQDLASLAVDRSALETVLGTFAGFRLLAFDRDPVTRGPTVEVAHEALLTEWSRLGSWIDEARDTLVMARRVGESAQEWVDSAHDPSYLLRGSRLEDVEQWAAQPGVELTATEVDYIATSAGHRREEMAAARHRRRRTVLALSMGLLLVSLLAIVAFAQRELARSEALSATVRELATTSGGYLDQNPELALLIAVEAFDASTTGGAEPMQEAVSAIAHAVADWRLVARIPSEGNFGPVASPDGSQVVTQAVEDLANLMVYDISGAKVSDLLGPREDVLAQTASFHPDGELVAVSYAIDVDQSYKAVPEGVPDVVVFQASTGAEVARIDMAGIRDHPVGLGEKAFLLSFSSSGDLLALSAEREVVVMDWRGGVDVSRIRFPGLTGAAMFLSEDTLLVPVEARGWSTYSISEGAELDTIEVAGLARISAADSLGRQIAYRAGDRVEVMDITTSEVTFSREAPGAQAVAISPDGTGVAYSGYDSTIHVVDLEGIEPDISLYGALNNVISLAFVGPNRVLSNGEDALLWDVSRTAVDELAVTPLTAPQWGFDVSPDERWLAYNVSVNQGASITHPSDGMRLVDLSTQEEVLVREGEMMSVPVGVRFVSPDFTLFGSLAQDGSSSVRRIPSWDLVRDFEACRSPLVFTPDSARVLLTGWVCPGEMPAGAATNSELVDLHTGDSLLTLPYRLTYTADFNPAGFFEAGRYLVASDQNTLGVWDTSTGDQLGTLRPQAVWNVILNVAFDPTGRFIGGGTAGGAVWVMDLAQVVDGAELVDALVFTRQAHTGAAPVPVISPQGVVATVGFDRMIRLWNLESGDLLYEFAADLDIPWVIFSPDGSRLLFPHGLSIRQIPVDPYELRSLAADLLTRDFLPDECARYSQQPCP